MAQFDVNVDTDPSPLARPSVRHHFENHIEANGMTRFEVEAVMPWIESISDVMTSDLDGLLGCSAPPAADGCVREFAARFGSAALRRPLTADEVDALAGLYDAVLEFDEPRAAVRGIMEASLQAPEFWYLATDTEIGPDDAPRYTSHALASRLSYFLWGTMPDRPLRLAADDGALHDPAVLMSQVERMLDDPRAAEAMVRFHREWLNVSPADRLTKDPEVYAAFNPELARDLDEEFSRFVLAVVRSDGSIHDLLTERRTTVNRGIEEALGLAPVANDDGDWVQRELEPERAGILGRPLYLASSATDRDSKLIDRGVTVVEKLLCARLTPPADATSVIPPPPAGAPPSNKLEQVEARAEMDACSSCHDTIDPIGLAFEAFDGLGVVRERYSDGVAIPTHGVLPNGDTFTNAAELVDALAQREQVRSCYATKWLEWSLGRDTTPAERCLAESLSDAPSIRAMLVQIATSDWMRRPLGGAQ